MAIINLNEEFKDKGLKVAIRVLAICLLLILIVLSIVTFLKIRNDEHVRFLGFEYNIPVNHPPVSTQHKTAPVIPSTGTLQGIEDKNTNFLPERKIKKTSEKAVQETPPVIQAKNVNTGVNSGIIGDNSTLNRAEQRALDTQSNARLVGKLQKVIQEQGLERNVKIKVSYQFGDKESAIFALEVANYLLSFGYNVHNEVGMGTTQGDGFTVKYFPDEGGFIFVYTGSIGLGAVL